MKLRAEQALGNPQQVVFGAGIFTALCVAIGAAINVWTLAMVPLALLFVLALVYDYRSAYFLLIFSLPFTIVLSLPGGLTTDIPSEPLMLVVMGCFLLTAPVNKPLSWEFLRHPVCIIILVSLFWAYISSLFSVDSVKSYKFILAKIWYLVSFLLMTGAVINNLNDLQRILRIFFVSLALVVLVSVVRHAALGFAFDMVNKSVAPFFVNHVIYAATIAMFVPYTWWLYQRAKGKTMQRTILIGALLLFLVAIGLSYTRASWLSIPAALMYLLVLRFKLTKLLLFGSLAGALGGVYYLAQENNFQQFAPEYEKTIFNEGNLGAHLEATYNFEDVSGMERVYRWVAAARMVYDKPLTGSGPNTFYPEYKKYTVSTFQTYVSRNPEMSTTHNYFLLTVAEQGIPGLVLFLGLVFYALILGERLYREALNKELRQTIVAAVLSIVIIVFHLLLNELIEVDKIGSFFYISLAVLIRIDLWQRAHSDLLKSAR